MKKPKLLRQPRGIGPKALAIWKLDTETKRLKRFAQLPDKRRVTKQSLQTMIEAVAEELDEIITIIDTQLRTK